MIRLRKNGEVIFKTIVSLSPEKTFTTEVQIGIDVKKWHYKLIVTKENGEELISYRPEKEEELKVPEAAKPALQPEELKTNEELFITGLHLEQYRHATFEPDVYYLEGLKRDCTDIRINNAYGKLLLRRGQIKESEKYFRKAIEKLTWKNPNPYDVRLIIILAYA